MAVLRPDQAQLTFAAEAAPGGDAELGNPSLVSSGASTYLTVAAAAGSRTITVNDKLTFIVGDFCAIGVGGFSAALLSEVDVRRIERISGISPATFTLDRPLGCNHDSIASNAELVKEVNGLTAQAGAMDGYAVITWVPGVYETVDTPDPVMAIEPRYFLGTQSKRDFFLAYKGQQTFTGSLSGITLLNGWPLRFPLGKVTTVGGQTVSGSTHTTYLTRDIKKGDTNFQVNAIGDMEPHDYIVVGYLGNIKATDPIEARKITSRVGNIFRVSQPFENNYTASSSLIVQQVTTSAFFYHHIVETIDLTSMSWHVRVADSAEEDANAFIRRYVGGKVGSASLSAEEGGLLTMNWDNVVFMDMLHNQQLHATTGTQAVTMYGAGQNPNAAGGAVNMPGYAIMLDILPRQVNNHLAETDPTTGGTVQAGFSTDEPYYFSQGTVTFWGEEFARIRSFQLSINNNEDPRYYINGQYGRHRGPSEIREQRREYGMACILALPDSAASTTGGLGTATALFRELLLEGTYDTTTMKGFKVQLDFEKSNGDAIRIFLPGLDPTTVSTTTLNGNLNDPTGTRTGEGNKQGCFIRRAEHAITTESPLQVEVDILFRNMHIIIKDKIPVYP